VQRLLLESMVDWLVALSDEEFHERIGRAQSASRR
jgi:hypothetical protein